MKDQLISFETAKLAKEKGFNEPVIFIYDQYGNLFDHRLSLNDLSMNSDEEFIYAAPTQSLLQRWLREEHGLHVEVMKMWNYKKTGDIEMDSLWFYRVTVCDFSKSRDEYITYIDKGDKAIQIYEEGLEEGLVKAVKQIS